jgi:hypothetical protein
MPTTPEPPDPWTTAAAEFATGPLDVAGHKVAAAYPHPLVRRAWAERTDQPAEVLLQRLHDETDPELLRQLMHLADRLFVPTNLLLILADHHDPAVALTAALRTDCPDDVAARTVRRLRNTRRGWLEQTLRHRPLVTVGRPQLQRELLAHLSFHIAFEVLPCVIDPATQDVAMRRLLSLAADQPETVTALVRAAQVPWTEAHVRRILTAVDRRFSANAAAEIRDGWLAGPAGSFDAQVPRVLRAASAGEIDRAAAVLHTLLSEPSTKPGGRRSMAATALARWVFNGPWYTSEDAVVRLLTGPNSRRFAGLVPARLVQVPLSDAARITVVSALVRDNGALTGPIVDLLRHLLAGRADLLTAVITQLGRTLTPASQTVLVRAARRGARTDDQLWQLWQTGLVSVADLIAEHRHRVELLRKLPLNQVLATAAVAGAVTIRWVLTQLTPAQVEVAAGLAASFEGSAVELVTAARQLAPAQAKDTVHD